MSCFSQCIVVVLISVFLVIMLYVVDLETSCLDFMIMIILAKSIITNSFLVLEVLRSIVALLFFLIN